MIAFDPDSFANSIQTVISGGNTTKISSTFYEEVPLFHILTAMYSQIALVKPADAMAMWAFIVGILFTLSAVVFSLYLNSNLRSALAAGALIAILSNSVTFSYTPIPNLHAAGLFSPLIICLVCSLNRERIFFIPVSLLFAALIFTHKLHPLIVVLSIFVVFLLMSVRRIVSERSSSFYFNPIFEILSISFGIVVGWTLIVQLGVPSLLLPGAIIFAACIYQITASDSKEGIPGGEYVLRFNRVSKNLMWRTLLLFGSLLAMQWVVITNLLYSVVVYRFLPLVNQTKTNLKSQSVSEFAKDIDPGLLDIFYHQSDVLILILPISIGWVYFFYHRSNGASLVLLAVSGISLSLIPTGIFAGVAGGLGAQRALLVFSPLGVAVLSAFLFNNSKNLIKMAFVLLVIIQVFSVGFVPDYPNSYRQYLTEDEINAKEFGLDHTTGVIYTDQFYATESIIPVTSRSQNIDRLSDSSVDSKFTSFGTDLLQKDIIGDDYQQVALRTSIGVHRTKIGNIKLAWNPEQEFDMSVDYSRVYDNGQVVYSIHKNT